MCLSQNDHEAAPGQSLPHGLAFGMALAGNIVLRTLTLTECELGAESIAALALLPDCLQRLHIDFIR